MISLPDKNITAAETETKSIVASWNLKIKMIDQLLDSVTVIPSLPWFAADSCRSFVQKEAFPSPFPFP